MVEIEEFEARHDLPQLEGKNIEQARASRRTAIVDAMEYHAEWVNEAENNLDIWCEILANKKYTENEIRKWFEDNQKRLDEIDTHLTKCFVKGLKVKQARQTEFWFIVRFARRTDTFWEIIKMGGGKRCYQDYYNDVCKSLEAISFWD